LLHDVMSCSSPKSNSDHIFGGDKKAAVLNASEVFSTFDSSSRDQNPIEYGSYWTTVVIEEFDSCSGRWLQVDKVTLTAWIVATCEAVLDIVMPSVIVWGKRGVSRECE